MKKKKPEKEVDFTKGDQKAVPRAEQRIYCIVNSKEELLLKFLAVKYCSLIPFQELQCQKMFHTTKIVYVCSMHSTRIG